MTPEDVRRIFYYDPETGLLFWRERKQGRTFGAVGHKDKDGYLIFKMNWRNVGKQSRNTSGLKSVSWHKLRKRWRATIRVDQKSIHLGMSECPAAAHFIYQIAADKYHGSFARIF